MQKNRKVLLTGGHAGSTAYALIKEVKDQEKNWEIYFISGRTSIEGAHTRVLPEISLASTDVRYFSILTGRLQRKFTIWTIPSLIKIPIGFIHALFLLIKIRPHLILSFGGYAAFPVVVVGWMLRRRIIIHEQTAVAGRANILSARFADIVAISRKSSARFFPKKKIAFTGNPISPDVVSLPMKNKLSDPPVIFVTGGASGSKKINDTIDNILNELLEKFIVIHQTGDLQYEYFMNRREQLNRSLREKYEVKSVIPSAKWPEYLNRSDLIVSRAGANIVAEILQIKRPAVLIPLPIAYLDEQKENAKIAQNAGCAEMILQKDLSPELLYKKISSMMDNWESYVNKARSYISEDKDATKKLIEIIEDKL